MRHTTLIVLAGLILSCSAHAASFDCAKAQTQVEKLICTDAELSKLDEELATAYTGALTKDSVAASIRQTQKQWLKERNRCANVGCVKPLYVARISTLKNSTEVKISLGDQMRMTARVLKQPDLGLNAGWDFVLRPGSGVEDWLEDGDDPMCQVIKDYMNRVASKWVLEGATSRTNYCTPAVRLAPFFSEPQWKELDPRKHEELIVRLMRFSHSPSEYFKPSPSTPGFDENYFRKQARDFIEVGGRLQHWRTRFTEVFYFPADGNNKPAPPGEQDVIQLRHPVTYQTGKDPKDSACQRPTWAGSIFLVTEDLSGPLRYLEPMERRSLLIYEGDPVLDSSVGGEIYIRSPYHGRASHSCRLTYPNHTSTQGK